MRKNNCDVIRRELDELMLEETCSAAAVAHLKECFACREFHQTQTKLRRMVGSLGTVAAPADFDFRLRARLANDANGPVVHYWAFARKGFAVAAVLVVFATGIVMVRNVMNEQTKNEVVAEKTPPVPQESPKPAETTPPIAPASAKELTAGVQDNTPRRINNERSVQPGPRIKRPLATREQASVRAEVISGVEPGGTTAVFPIDASLQSFRISLDDGRGNARTVFVPTIRFGSQRMLPGNQFAQKNIW